MQRRISIKGGTTMKKLCNNCKFKSASYYEKPCVQCLNTYNHNEFKVCEPIPVITVPLNVKLKEEQQLMTKYCVNCKYSDLDFSEEPCKECKKVKTESVKWEPKEEQPTKKVCITCKFYNCSYYDGPCAQCVPSKDRAKWQESEQVINNLGKEEQTMSYCYCRNVQDCKTCSEPKMTGIEWEKQFDSRGYRLINHDEQAILQPGVLGSSTLRTCVVSSSTYHAEIELLEDQVLTQNTTITNLRNDNFQLYEVLKKFKNILQDIFPK